MRAIWTGMLSLALLASLTATGSAAQRAKKHRHHAGQHARVDYQRGNSGRIERQKEYIADKLPIGSHDWWEQMAREGRTVCCN